MPVGRLSRVVSVCLFACAAYAVAGEADPAAAYREWHLAPGHTVVGERIAVGHFELELASGLLFPIEGPAGDPVGFRFAGRARFTYRSADAIDRQVFEGNASRLGFASIVRGGEVATAELTGATVLLARDPDRPFAVYGGTLPVPPQQEAALRGVAAELDRAELAFDQRAALARLDGSGQYAFVALEGPAGRLDYEYDDLETWEESLSVSSIKPGHLPSFRQSLSRQPIEGGPAAHLKPAVLVDADVRIVTDDNRHATIESRLVLRTGAPDVRALRFDLVSNRDPRGLGWNSERNALHVVRVVDEQGRRLPFSHRCHRLLVDFLQPRELGATVRIEVDTEGDVLTGPDGRTAERLVDLYSVPWYPRPTGWGRAWFKAHVAVRTKKPYRPVTTGRTIDFRDDGDAWVLEAQSDAPGWDLGVFAGTYTTRSAADTSLQVDVHGYSRADRGHLEALLGRTWSLVSIYTSLLGPLERRQLAVIEYPSLDGSGLSPGGGAILTTYTFVPLLARPAAGAPPPEALLAHELAHQWFGHQAIPSDWLRDNWLVESFAEYASAVALDLATEQETARVHTGFASRHASWRAHAPFCAAFPIAAANDLAGELAPAWRHCLLYARGPLVLHMLRNIAGEERFFMLLREFLDLARTAPVSERDFEATASRVVGEDLGWFFDQWLRRAGTPRVDVTYALEPGEAGEVFLAGTVRQPGSAPRRIHVPLVLEYDGDRAQVVRVYADRTEQAFRVALPARPRKVLVDPGRELLAEYR